MARSTYISENLTQKQIDFMLMLDDYELDIFTLEDVKKQIGDKVDDITEIRENLIFKGGTCLRKCWFPDYRFSYPK
jgi:hypothetical protein